MYLSSRVKACASAAALLAAALGSTELVAPGSARAELAARPAFAGIRPTIVPRVPRLPYSGIAPTIVQRGRGAYPASGIRPTIVPRTRRGYDYGYGGGGLGYDGAFATDGATDAGADYVPPEPGSFGQLPPPFVIPAPRPCPQIIEIGRGFAPKPKTRVVYGAPLCGP